MVDFAASHSETLTTDSGAVRVLVISDCQENEPGNATGNDEAIRVVATVKTGDEAIERIAVLPPDVVLMLADNRTPTPGFHEAIMDLCAARLADRVVMMVGNPAGYLALAIKARAAVLLPMHAPHRVVVSALREVRAWSGDATTGHVTGTANERHLSPNTGGD